MVWDPNAQDYSIAEAINVLDVSSLHAASGTECDIYFLIAAIFTLLLFSHALFANRPCCWYVP